VSGEPETGVIVGPGDGVVVGAWVSVGGWLVAVGVEGSGVSVNSASRACWVRVANCESSSIDSSVAVGEGMAVGGTLAPIRQASVESAMIRIANQINAVTFFFFLGWLFILTSSFR
jgi:hypothetical protein